MEPGSQDTHTGGEPTGRWERQTQKAPARLPQVGRARVGALDADRTPKRGTGVGGGYPSERCRK